jgi:aryl-alcohol dehydrogenase-like predicted oxidoreductase
VELSKGLAAVGQLAPLVPANATLAQWALRWILMFDAVTCAIPGAKTRAQALENAGASALPALSESDMARIRALYDSAIREQVHQRW